MIRRAVRTPKPKTPRPPMSSERAREMSALGRNHPNNPVGKPITSERARELSAMRRTFGAGPGPPLSGKPRCACGAMTLKRALARGHDCTIPRRWEKELA